MFLASPAWLNNMEAAGSNGSRASIYANRFSPGEENIRVNTGSTRNPAVIIMRAAYDTAMLFVTDLHAVLAKMLTDSTRNTPGRKDTKRPITPAMLTPPNIRGMSRAGSPDITAAEMLKKAAVIFSIIIFAGVRYVVISRSRVPVSLSHEIDEA